MHLQLFSCFIFCFSIFECCNLLVVIIKRVSYIAWDMYVYIYGYWCYFNDLRPTKVVKWGWPYAVISSSEREVGAIRKKCNSNSLLIGFYFFFSPKARAANVNFIGKIICFVYGSDFRLRKPSMRLILFSCSMAFLVCTCLHIWHFIRVERSSIEPRSFITVEFWSNYAYTTSIEYRMKSCGMHLSDFVFVWNLKPVSCVYYVYNISMNKIPTHPLVNGGRNGRYIVSNPKKINR